MNKLPWLATYVLIFILIAVGAVAFYLQAEVDTEPTESKEMEVEAQSEFTVDEFDLFKIDEFDSEKHGVEMLAKTGGKSLFTATLLYSPALFLSDDTTGNVIRLGVMDYLDEALLFSPDKKHLLLAIEEGVLVVYIETLEYEKVFTPYEGSIHGLLSGYPTFHPRVRWLNNNQIEVTLYLRDTFYAEEPTEPAPLERQVISL